MKKLLCTLILVFMAFPALAQDHAHEVDSWLKPVESQYVCMVNNKAFDTEQIAVDVGDKTYYGCCAMCKGKLEKSTSIRAAIDPVSGETVDKATAVIGADADNTVYYFENQENLHSFAGKPKPQNDGHGTY